MGAIGKIGDLLISVVCGNLCKLLYALVKQAYNLLYSIANTTLFTGTEAGSIGGFAHNIYTILGVIMMFKLAFSLVSYIVNPDAMSDKNNGLGSVLKNVVIVVGLTLLVPIIFTQAMKLQRIILKEDIIGRIVTGVAKTGGSTMDESAGKTMAFNLLAGFVQPNENVAACDDVTSIMMGSDETAQNACFDAITDSDAKDAFRNAWHNSDTNELMSMKLLTAPDSDDELIFDFDWLVAPLVGGFTAYILILFCIDTAVRSITLAFLQLLAPVPIVSYIDPKGQKGIFNKWVNMCVSTYLDLFIRLAAIYFAIYIIQVVINGGQMQTVNATGDGYDEPTFFVKVFMVLGCLMFAKQVPDIIKEFTGKGLGDFTLNPAKKIGNGALGGAAIVAGAGLVGRTAGNLGKFAGGQALRPVKTLGNAAGNKFASTSGGKWFLDKSADARAKMAVAGNKFRSTAFGQTMGTIGADAAHTMGISNKTLAKNKNVTSAVGNMESRALERIKNGSAGSLSNRYNKYVEGINVARNTNNANEAARLTGEMNNWLNSNDSDGAASQYIDGALKGQFDFKDATGKTIQIKSDFSDKTMGAFEKDYQAAVSSAGYSTKSTAAEMHKQSSELKGQSGDIARQQIGAKEAKKK